MLLLFTAANTGFLLHTYVTVPCRTFSAKNALIGFLVYAIPGIFGITLCFHRMLTHRCDVLRVVAM
jgi:fatty-acid desaturase